MLSVVKETEDDQRLLYKKNKWAFRSGKKCWGWKGSIKMAYKFITAAGNYKQFGYWPTLKHTEKNLFMQFIAKACIRKEKTMNGLKK